MPALKKPYVVFAVQRGGSIRQRKRSGPRMVDDRIPACILHPVCSDRTMQTSPYRVVGRKLVFVHMSQAFGRLLLATGGINDTSR
jgi:hypothetical protein